MVNEGFEDVFDAVLATQVAFQEPVEICVVAHGCAALTAEQFRAAQL